MCVCVFAPLTHLLLYLPVQLHAVPARLLGRSGSAGAKAQLEAAVSGAQGPKTLVPLSREELSFICFFLALQTLSHAFRKITILVYFNS